MSSQNQPSSSPSIADRRIERRSPVFYRLDVTDQSNQHVGYLLDVTLEGMRVRCNPGIDMSSLGTLKILFPHWMELGKGVVVSGRFVWTKPASENRSEGGFVFEGLKSVQQNNIEKLIEIVVKAATEDELL